MKGTMGISKAVILTLSCMRAPKLDDIEVVSVMTFKDPMQGERFCSRKSSILGQYFVVKAPFLLRNRNTLLACMRGM